ncbi:MAG TPA: phenylalanine--tRNA ligase subunit beta, partial [Candidatus Melainabacteria bacterium]|nr:phenylalanine--tRNA ligase subunit beta [Candidatus Melainabacteria bacterium]
MKLSFNWLCDYVDLEGISVETVAEKLTMGAFEVEEVTTVGPDITGSVKVGEILEIHPHPNADKIRMTKTRVEKDAAPLDIVCGAANIEVGQYIPVALPGSVVVNRKTGEKLEIKKSEIRGVESNGMLCSPPELGITDGDSEGILILDKAKYELGDDLIEKMWLKPDCILHVEPRSNRGDALCVIGLAREVAALTGRSLKTAIDTLDKERESEGSEFKVEIEDETDCSFFTARVIKNVKVGESPL